MKPELDRANRHIGGRLRGLRGRLGLTQKDVGRFLGVSHQQIKNYEDGSNRLTASALFVLSQQLGLDPAAFFEGLVSPPVPDGFAEEPAAGYVVNPAPPTASLRIEEAFAQIRSRRMQLLAIRLVEAVAADERAAAETRCHRGSHAEAAGGAAPMAAVEQD